MSEFDLAELEARVGQKWATAASARAPHFDVTGWTVDFQAWFGTLLEQTDPPEIPADWPQFPPERWLTYPTRRLLVLMTCDHMLDFDELPDEQWFQLCFLMLYGGRERVS